MKYGLFGYPELAAPDDVIEYLSLHLPGTSSLLELGCGRGSMIRGLRQAGWMGNYCGVDISKRAISDARRFSDERSTWVISDFESFQSPSKWDAIAMIESIYYIKLDTLPRILNKIVAMLSERGLLLLRVHDLDRHREYVETIRSLYATEKVGGNLLRISASSGRIDSSAADTSATDTAGKFAPSAL